MPYGQEKQKQETEEVWEVFSPSLLSQLMNGTPTRWWPWQKNLHLLLFISSLYINPIVLSLCLSDIVFPLHPHLPYSTYLYSLSHFAQVTKLSQDTTYYYIHNSMIHFLSFTRYAKVSLSILISLASNFLLTPFFSAKLPHISVYSDMPVYLHFNNSKKYLNSVKEIFYHSTYLEQIL